MHHDPDHGRYNVRRPRAGRASRAAGMLILALVMAGCGQTGDLYLPDDRQEEDAP